MDLALLLAVAAAVGLVTGWVGARGSTRAVVRRVGLLEDDLVTVDRRLSRREGQAGEARRRAQRDDDAAMQAEMAAILARSPAAPAASSPAATRPRTRAELLARGREVLHAGRPAPNGEER